MASKRSPEAVRDAIIERYPKTYGQELGITRIDTPSGSYRLLVMALLMSARISASLAHDAARALFAAGWRTPRSMAAATWAQRAKVLNQSGYARFDERTSSMLADMSSFLLDAYRGDPRRMRAEAEGDPDELRHLVTCCKGIGDVGVDIFFREAQAVWPELYPFVDDRAAKAAGVLGLPTSASSLADLAGGADDLALLLSGMVRTELDKAVDEVLDAAG